MRVRLARAHIHLVGAAGEGAAALHERWLGCADLSLGLVSVLGCRGVDEDGVVEVEMLLDPGRIYGLSFIESKVPLLYRNRAPVNHTQKLIPAPVQPFS